MSHYYQKKLKFRAYRLMIIIGGFFSTYMFVLYFIEIQLMVLDGCLFDIFLTG